MTGSSLTRPRSGVLLRHVTVTGLLVVALLGATTPTAQATAGSHPDVGCDDLSTCDPINPLVVPRPDSVDCVHGGRRLQAVLAYPEAAPPEATVTDQLRHAVRQAGEFVRARAAELDPGVPVRLRVACGPDREPTVLPLPVPPWAAGYPSAQALRDVLLERYGRTNSEKYLVYYTAPTTRGPYSGEAFFEADDRPTRSNRNNDPGTVAVQYRLVQGTTAYSRPYWPVLLHEYLHTLGAVQPTAPHADGGHSREGKDVMDSGEPSASAPRCEVLTLDCGADDYFHPSPPPGSYLATHWNVAGRENAWISRG